MDIHANGEQQSDDHNEGTARENPDSAPPSGREPGTEQQSTQVAQQQVPDAGRSDSPGDEVEEWGEESFPASDPPQSWAGHDRPAT